MSADHFVSVTLFDRDGATALKRLHRAYSMQWLDENDAPGSFSFTIPAEDDGQVAIGRIVKFAYGTRSDAYRWAGVIESLTHRLTDDADVVQVSGRGVRALLEGAVVYQGSGEADQTRSFTDTYPSAIMRTFLDEAHARGTLTEITAGFSNTTDSNGVAFDSETDLTVDVEVGTSLADVADQHQEAVLDGVWVDADLQLQYAITRGTDTTATSNPVVFRAMQNIVSFEQKVDGPVRNVTLISYSDGGSLTEKVSTVSGTTSTYGRREQFLDLNNVGNATKAERYANKMMKRSADPTDGATVEVTDDGVKPYIGYEVGDYIWVVAKNGNRTKYRVRAITVTADGSGNVRVVPELGTVQADLDARLRKALQRLESRNAKGDASLLSPPQAGLTTTVPSGTFVVGTPIGSEFVYQSPTLQADTIDISDPTLAPYTSLTAGIEDTAGAAGAGTGAICIIGASGPSLLSFNTVDGLVETLPLPGATPAWLSRWGTKLLAGTRGVSGNGTVYVIESGAVTTLSLAPPATGQRLVGGGPAADGAGFLGVWVPSTSVALGYIVKYDAAGTVLGSQPITMPAAASTFGPAVVDNGYVVIRAGYSAITNDYVLVTPADITSPVTTIAGIDENPAAGALGTISSDGYCWISGNLANQTLYRVDCAAGTLAVYPYGQPAVTAGGSVSTMLSVSATKAVWIGRTTAAASYPTIINLVEQSSVINGTSSQLTGGSSGTVYAACGTLLGSGEVAFVARVSQPSTGLAYRLFLKVAGP